MKTILVIFLSICLTGCFGIFEKKKDDPVIDTKPVVINKEALEPCALLPEDMVVKSFEDGLVQYVLTTKAYAVCAGKQATSIKLLKQFGGGK